MKGQHRIISEILLFAIGIIITSYVVVNFNTVRTSVSGVTLHDQMESVADLVATAVAKASTEGNTSIRLEIPESLSEKIYTVSLRANNDGGKVIVRAIDGSAYVEREIFNTDYDNTVSSNDVINYSDVTSTARFVEIIKNEKITIARMTD